MNRSWILAMLAGASSILLGAPSAHADLNLGTAANYSLVALGPSMTFGFNSGPQDGSFLIGNHLIANFSGGASFSGGSIYYDTTVTGTSTFNQVTFAPPGGYQQVSTSVTQQAFTDAKSVADYASGLSANNSIVNNTITGNGGLNVINVGTLGNPPLNFVGGPNDMFVINVSGNLSENKPMTLTGVTPSQILWNFTGTSGIVFSTSGGGTEFGTFLAAYGGGFQFSNLNLTGELINLAGDIQLVSGSKITSFVPLSPDTSAVPEPSSMVAVLVIGGLTTGRCAWRRRRSA